jgi:hypothetical protein
MLVSFSDSQMQSIFAGATAPGPIRGSCQYLCLIADALDVDDTEIGDGSVARAVADAIRTIRRNPAPA